MPVLFQKMIHREDLRRNQDVLFVFGDNIIRKGMGGQAGAMRGEPNAVGVATKLRPSLHPEAYFGEEPEQVLAQKRVIDEDMKPLFDKVKAGGIVVWPADGIGTGLSELPQRAPTTFEYMEQKLAALIKTGLMFSKENSQ